MGYGGVTSKSHIQIRNVIDILIPDEYEPKICQFDAALLKLEYPMDLNELVGIISIQCLSPLGPATNIVVDNINQPDYEEVKILVVATRECTPYYRQGGNTTLCGYETKGQRGQSVAPWIAIRIGVHCK